MPRIDDENQFEDGLRHRPETYKTILQEDSANATSRTITKRKIERLFNDSRIFKYPLDGTRSGTKLFFHPDKKYIIVIQKTRIGYSHYYCKACEEEPTCIVCKKAFRLDDTRWRDEGDLRIPYNEVLRCF